MFNALFLLGSTNKKLKKINWLFASLWILFMLKGSNFSLGIVFPLINILAFLIVFGIGNVVKGKYSNLFVSISSILIWSILIDTICYFVYPDFVGGKNLVAYVFNGILFNYKYVFTNIIAVMFIKVAEIIFSKNKSLSTTKSEKKEILNNA